MRARCNCVYEFIFLCVIRWDKNVIVCRSGHAGIALRLSRLQVPLDAERTLELGHHILKAHIYKNMTLHKNSSRDLQAHWISSVSADVSEALSTLRNIYSPNVKVTPFYNSLLNNKSFRESKF